MTSLVIIEVLYAHPQNEPVATPSEHRSIGIFYQWPAFFSNAEFTRTPFDSKRLHLGGAPIL
jgi:hypothetical protein